MCLNLLVSLPPDEIKSLVASSFATFQNADKVRALEQSSADLVEKLAQKMHDCICDDPHAVMERIAQRRAIYLKLTRLKKQRKKLLKLMARGVKSGETESTVIEIVNDISKLELELAGMACSNCGHFSLCHRGKSNHFIKLVERARLISEAYEDAQNNLWNAFLKHFNFLIQKGFSDRSGKLTPDGLWASKLRLDQPLIIAELIRKGLLNELSPQLLAGIVAVFVNDKFRDIDIVADVQWDKKPLRACFYRMKDSIKDLTQLMKENGFDVPQLQFWPAAAVYTWACELEWDCVLNLTSIDEGDLAMLIYRTADNLRQLTSLQATHPFLAEKAYRSIRLLLREPVIIPT